MFVTVWGIPKAQPRARAYRKGAHAAVYDPGTAADWKRQIILAVRAEPGFATAPWSGPIRLDLWFFMPRPKRLCRKRDPDGSFPCPGRPDRDNLEKAVMDALVDAELLLDDAQVCAGEVWKLYVPKPGKGVFGREGPRATMEIKQMAVAVTGAADAGKEEA